MTLPVRDLDGVFHGVVHRFQCSAFEWHLLLDEAETYAWWSGITSVHLHLCDACNAFTGVETEGTSHALTRVRCLQCGAFSTHDFPLSET